MITSARRLSRERMAVLLPSSAAETAAENVSISDLKPGISTGGLGYAGLLDMPSCTALIRCSRSASDRPRTPNEGLITFSFVFAIVRHLLTVKGLTVVVAL